MEGNERTERFLASKQGTLLNPQLLVASVLGVDVSAAAEWAGLGIVTTLYLVTSSGYALSSAIEVEVLANKSP